MKVLQREVRLPAIDYSVSWAMKPEKQPWRRTSPMTRKVVLKSLGGVNGGEGSRRSPSSQQEPA